MSSKHQFSNNTIILFATQYKNDNTVFIGLLQCLAVLRCCELFVSGKLNIKYESAM